MISQSFYLDLQVMASGYLANHPDVPVDAECRDFIRPYILVIHQPTKRGFYIGGSFQHIIDVLSCQEPSSAVKVVRHYLPKGYVLPAWVKNQKVEYQAEEFDTFWLY